MFTFFVSGEVGEEKIIFYGQDYEQAEIGSKESSGNEKHSFGQPGPSSWQKFTQGSIFS